MPFCPNCGNDVGNGMFCPNCGAKQGERREPYGPESSHPSSGYLRQQTLPDYPPVRRASGILYDETICCVLCCCVTPIAGLLYYLLTEHPEKYPDKRY